MADDTRKCNVCVICSIGFFNSLANMLWITVAFLFAFCGESVFANELVEMKIVDEPSSYGFGNSNLQQWGGGAEQDKLKMRVQPANVSGPPHLFFMHGRCYSKTFENYKYSLCPFSNVTQHEQGYHWNPYNGVLGVWQEWEVENNTFVSMEMQEGDDCGQIHRSIKVRLECGNSSEIMSVSEPKTCHYVLVFHTPLVCHPQALLVYPTLSPELRAKWDQLEGRKYRKELTEKGYKKRLQWILEEAGLRLTADQRHNLAAAVVTKEEKEKEKQSQSIDFTSLAHCSQRYRRLQQEVEQLKAELATYKNTNGTASARNVSSETAFEKKASNETASAKNASYIQT